MTALMVVLGAMVGAPARYLVSLAVRPPWGTFIVNVAGSFLLGLLAAAAIAIPAMSLLGIGFCGALTTYSTFGYETVRLIQDGAGPRALLNVTGSIVAGLAAAYLGMLFAGAIG